MNSTVSVRLALLSLQPPLRPCSPTLPVLQPLIFFADSQAHVLPSTTGPLHRFFLLHGIVSFLSLISNSYQPSNFCSDILHTGKAFPNPTDPLLYTLTAHHLLYSMHLSGLQFHIYWYDLWVNISFPKWALYSMMAGTVIWFCSPFYAPGWALDLAPGGHSNICWINACLR